MDKNKIHIIVAEIFNTTNKIEVTAQQWDVRDSNSIQFLEILENCQYLKSLDKLLHDELFPDCKENENKGKC